MRILTQRLGRIISAFLLLSVFSARSAVIINEIYYHPVTTNLLEEWFELYNPGPTNVNISGWRMTKGVSVAFPTNTTINAGGFLVVAADVPTFNALHPGVPNVASVSCGPLGGHSLELSDSSSTVVSSVSYGNQGDWAARILTTNYTAYYGHATWEWYAAHDGVGSSLELINPAQPITYAHNWGSSTAPGGTPGAPNSIARTNVAPFITGVAHSPVIPQPTDVVTVSARLVDEHTNGISVTLYYRNATTATPPAFSSTLMLDDGAHNDGLAGDGIFAAILPAQPSGTVIEFYIQANDLEGNFRTYPAVVPPTNSLRTANLLYQVDDGTYNGSQPLYRIIMTEMERAELYNIGSPNCPDYDSDAQMNATWITSDGVLTGGTTTQLHYNAGVRNRGHGSRHTRPNNYHVNIASDKPWKGLTGINLNSQYAYSQILGSAVFRKLEVPMAESQAVQVRVNSTNIMSLPGQADNNSFGSYAANEQYNNDFVQRAFATDPDGNSYRGIRDQTLCDVSRNSVADFSWHGANFAQAVYTNAYFKQNNFLENDFSDMLDLLSVLNSTNGYYTSNYVGDIQHRINVEEWMKYMAINTLLDSDETALCNGIGDDYALYRGMIDTRFQALPYDLDTVMGRALTTVPPMHSIFRMTALPTMDKFMKTPEFAPLYYKWLKNYIDTTFASSQMNPFLDQLLNTYLTQGTIDVMKGFNTAQVSNVLAQIPLTLTVSNALPVVSGYPQTASPTVALYGTANAIDTRAIVVAGVTSSWTGWRGTWTNNSVALSPGVNRILVQALGTNGTEIARATVDIWYNNGAGTTTGGTIAADTTWTAAAGPYNVTSSLTVNSNFTLTIQPGTTIYLSSGVNFTVANGGRLLAEGTASAPIRFSVVPGSGVSWGGMVINGANGSPETRIAYATFEGNSTTCIEVAGGTIYLDHSTFLTTTHQYVALDSASFLLSWDYFPTSTAAFELLHGTGGIKSGGRGIVRDCFFGGTSGNNDIMDYTGGNRDLGQPIIQYYNNVFVGGTDDILDLDGTDAWIEGNIFLHAHMGPQHTVMGSSSAISGGDTGSDTSQVTIIGNIFYDCDNVANAKQGNFFTLLNNTVVHQNHTAGNDVDGAVVELSDEGAPEAQGMYLEGNIIYDAEKLARNWTNAILTVSNNLMPFSWSGAGGGNSTNAPLLKYIPQLSETAFTTWEQAQVMWDWFSLMPGSPGIGTGPNGRDKGAVNRIGASISGEPYGTNNQTSATLNVGILRSGFGMPVSGWPNGAGYTHYKYRLDSGAWGAETVSTTPITLSGLASGQHHVEVAGKRDSGFYQDDAAFGPDALVTTSRTWTVDTTLTRPTVRLNEILAQNGTTLTNSGNTPDLIELYNYGSAAVDLSGMGLTDNADIPFKYTFPNGTALLGAGQYLVLFADSKSGGGIHVGFSLKAGGDDVYLHDKASSGGALLDSVVFGPQLTDYSIGRLPDGSWVLCKPTFGSANTRAPLSDPHGLKINEWLADEQFVANNDFIEIFNPGAYPAPLGGLYLSDAEGAPDLNQVPALSFMAGSGYQVFTADGDTSQGADHVNFKLDADGGIIMLSDSALNPIDIITYGPQRTDVSQGRSPSGSGTLIFFSQPTAGAPNPAPNGVLTVTNVTAQIVKLITPSTFWRWNNSGGTNFGTDWITNGYPDSSWSNSLPLFGSESTPNEYLPYTFPASSFIPAPDVAGGHITVYFRTHFNWNGSLTNFTLISTNYIDDGVAYYLNTNKVGSLRMPAVYTYNTLCTQQLTEGATEILTFPTNSLRVGDNVLAAELHQNSTASSDDVFGMFLSAVQYNTNVVTTIVGVPVLLNEVLASNHSVSNAAGATPDLIELFNNGSNSVSLADVSLTDDANNPRKYVFPAGLSVPAGGYFVIYCDSGQPVSTNNTGFSLNAGGGSVLLFNALANGGGLIDGVNYGLQVEDRSIGRVPNGSGAWSLTVPTPGGLNSAAGLGSAAGLLVNEWLADPGDGSASWFELYNGSSQPVALSGYYFTDDLTKKTLSPVPPLTFIGSGANGFVKFIADNNPNAGADHVKFLLPKTGHTIGLYSQSGTLVTALTFGSQLTGVSQGRFPDGSGNIVNFTTTISPGHGNYLPLGNVVVNEALTHTDPPLEDAIEFYNPSLSSVNIGGWFISNAQDDLKRYRIADGTTIPGHGYKVFYEYQFNPTNGSSTPFTLNSAHGDSVWLAQSDGSGNLTGYRAAAALGAAAHGVSFGRYANSIGQVDYPAASALSFGVDNPSTVAQFRTGGGEPNAYPLVGPVVFNEIMYFPPMNGTEDNTDDEYVELLNISGSAVQLYDPAAPTNTWSVAGGISFTFPQNVTLPAGGYLLLVNFDPAFDTAAVAEFRARYDLSGAVPLYGPYGGHLANSGERIQLYRPDPPQLPPHSDAGFVPQVLVDDVNYLSAVGWPTNAAGNGSSLQRLVASDYGNDPINWYAAAATPAQANSNNTADADGDGLPDAWEIQYFGSINDPRATPNADPDGDGFSNLQEYLAGTNPLDPNSRLKIDSASVSGGTATLQFTAVAGKTYTVLYRNSLGNGGWGKLIDVPAQATTTAMAVRDFAAGSTSPRFYRLATPRIP